MANFLNVESSRCVEVVARFHGFLFHVSTISMTFPKSWQLCKPYILTIEPITNLKPPSDLLKYSQFSRLSSSMVLIEPEPKAPPERKLLKVAFVGRPNAGKSTLINRILNLNICGVSHKSHTTRMLFKGSLVRNNTQIVVVDTPGLVTAKEFQKFHLSNNFRQGLGRNVMNEVDIIGVIHEVREPRDFFKFPLSLTQHVNNICETKPLFLIINKIDLIIDKDAVTDALSSFENQTEEVKRSTILQKFSKIFFTSAVHNKGVLEIVDYLFEQAKPGEWVFETDKAYNTPMETVILELIRAKFMDNYPQEVPYYCRYEIEYLKENNLGEIICVGLVTCKYAKHVALITSKKKKLRLICKSLESELFKILRKVFRIRVVVQASKKAQ